MAAAEVSAGAAVGAGFLAARSASRPLHAAMKIVDAEAAYALTQFLKTKVINILGPPGLRGCWLNNRLEHSHLFSYSN
jgi:hypothetical protein